MQRLLFLINCGIIRQVAPLNMVNKFLDQYFMVKRQEQGVLFVLRAKQKRNSSPLSLNKSIAIFDLIH